MIGEYLGLFELPSNLGGLPPMAWELDAAKAAGVTLSAFRFAISLLASVPAGGLMG